MDNSKIIISVCVVITLFYLPKDVANKPYAFALPSKLLCGSNNEKCVALTFDDGPYPVYTARILKILDDYQIKATFFVVGKMVKEHPDLVEEISSKEHEIENHSYDDLRMTNLLSEDVIKQIDRTKREIQKVIKKDAMLFRPPGGRYNERILNVVSGLGYSTVLWSVNSNDYGSSNSGKISQNVIKGAHNGAIILLHNGIEATVEALPTIIEKLKEKGYNFITVSALIDKLYKKDEIVKLKEEETEKSR